MGTDDAFGGSEHNQALACVTLVTSIIGCTASLFMIALIRQMRTKTGHTSHVLLVLVMSYFQIIYDFTFLFRVVDCGYYIFIVANFFQIFAGTTGSLISNWISLIAFLIVVFHMKFDANQYFYSILSSAVLPGLIVAVLYISTSVPEDRQNEAATQAVEYLYYYIRLALIFVNFVLCTIIIYKVETISSKSKSKKASPQEIAIKLLSRRMIYYPIIQAFSRIAFSWYEQIYGFSLNGNTDNHKQYRLMVLIAVTTPFVSVGYLVIFLMMQPNAYREAKLLLCGSATVSQSPTGQNKDDNKDNQNETRTTTEGNEGHLNPSNFSRTDSSYGVPKHSRTESQNSVQRHASWITGYHASPFFTPSLAHGASPSMERAAGYSEEIFFGDDEDDEDLLVTALTANSNVVKGRLHSADGRGAELSMMAPSHRTVGDEDEEANFNPRPSRVSAFLQYLSRGSQMGNPGTRSTSDATANTSNTSQSNLSRHVAAQVVVDNPINNAR